MKLFVRITIIIVVTKLLVLFTIGYLVYFRTIEALERSVGEQQLNTAANLLDNVNLILDRRVGELKMISGLHIFEETLLLQKLSAVDLLKFKSEARDIKNSSGPWVDLALYDLAGKPIASITDEFASSTESVSPAVVNLPIASSSVYSVFKQASRGQVTYSDTLVSNLTGKPVLYIAAPIFNNENDQIIGVVIGTLDWNMFLLPLANITEPQLVYLYNKEGVFIGSNASKFNAGILYEKDIDRSSPDNVIGSRNRSSFVAPSFKGGFNALVSYIREVPGSQYATNGWFLVMETPTDIAFSAAQLYAMQLFIAIFVIIAISGFMLMFLIDRKVIKPVRFLTKVAKEIAGGQFDRRAVVTSKDEIGQLASTFNNMADSLAQIGKYVQDIIMSMPTALFVVDETGRIKSINESARRIVGVKTRDSLIGMNVFKYFYSLQAETSDKLKKVMLGKQFVDLRCQLINNKKDKISVSVSASILNDKNGQIDSVLFVVKDMREISDYAKRRLSAITPVLRKVALGDFSEEIVIPEEEDEFTEHLVGLNLMIEDFRELVKEIEAKSRELELQNQELTKLSQALKEAKEGLESKVSERTKELESAKADLEEKVAERTQAFKELNNNLEKEVLKRTAELQDRLLEVERFNRLAVGRELKMVDLKQRLSELEQQLAKIKKERI